MSKFALLVTFTMNLNVPEDAFCGKWKRTKIPQTILAIVTGVGDAKSPTPMTEHLIVVE
jgi:hypothetical protein